MSHEPFDPHSDDDDALDAALGQLGLPHDSQPRTSAAELLARAAAGATTASSPTTTGPKANAPSPTIGLWGAKLAAVVTAAVGIGFGGGLFAHRIAHRNGEDAPAVAAVDADPVSEHPSATGEHTPAVAATKTRVDGDPAAGEPLASATRPVQKDTHPARRFESPAGTASPARKDATKIADGPRESAALHHALAHLDRPSVPAPPAGPSGDADLLALDAEVAAAETPTPLEPILADEIPITPRQRTGRDRLRFGAAFAETRRQPHPLDDGVPEGLPVEPLPGRAILATAGYQHSLKNTHRSTHIGLDADVGRTFGSAHRAATASITGTGGGSLPLGQAQLDIGAMAGFRAYWGMLPRRPDDGLDGSEGPGDDGAGDDGTSVSGAGSADDRGNDLEGHPRYASLVVGPKIGLSIGKGLAPKLHFHLSAPIAWSGVAARPQPWLQLGVGVEFPVKKRG